MISEDSMGNMLGEKNLAELKFPTFSSDFITFKFRILVKERKKGVILKGFPVNSSHATVQMRSTPTQTCTEVIVH